MKKALLLFSVFAFLGSQLSPIIAQELERGDEAFSYGYYKTAIDYYKEAYKKKAEVATAYKIAQSCRLANDYDEAVKYYTIVNNSPTAMLYPHCEYYLGSMYRMCGMPDSALLFLQSYLRTASDSTLEERTRQEIRSCQWASEPANKTAKSPYSVLHEGRNINTEFSESGAVMMGDSLLFFSSMREISKSTTNSEINSDFFLMQIFQASFNGDSPDKAVPNQWGLNSKEKHSCNVAFDPIHSTIYFTLCSVDDFSDIPCDIYYSTPRRGKWQKPRRLGGNVNIEGYSNTHPAVAYMPDSSVILYFASNRPGGLGGYDIWYTIIAPGRTPTEPVNLGTPVNTPGNEITPFYDNDSSILYFSSDWHLGYGGYDIFASHGSRDGWQQPENLGQPVNSPANDIYFTVNPTSQTAQSATRGGYITSNRRGSYFISGNTCCNDIYSWSIEGKKQPQRRPAPVTEPVIPQQKTAVHHILPIKLYFHNDEPDPKSKLATTTTNYFQTYNRYMFMRSDYKRAHTKAAGKVVYDSICDAIDYFFDYDVQYNCERFEQFLELLLLDLRAGHRISMTVAGYASPIHTSQYNELISKRRIASIVNQIMEYNKGALTHFMGTGGGSLQIREVAYGSSQALKGVSSDPGQKNKSVYSVEAARERRIEILDYQYLEDDSSLISCLHLPSRAMHIGTFKTGQYADVQIELDHTAISETTLDFISIGSPDVKVVGYSKLTPGRKLVVYLRMDNRRSEPAVSSFLPITLRVAGEQITQTMFVEYTLEK